MTVSVNLIKTLLEAINLGGIETRQFLKAADLPEDFFSNLQNRISLDQYDTLQTIAIDLTQDPALGLHMGERVSLSSLSVFGNLLLNCAGLEEVIHVFNRYHYIVSDCAPSRLECQNGLATLTYEYLRSTPLCNRLRSEYGIAAFTRMAHSMLNDQMHITEVHFEHPAPDYIAEYQRLFKAPVRFNCPSTRITFPENYLNNSFNQPNPELYQFLRKQAEELLMHLRGSSLSVQIKSLLTEQYQGVKPQIEQIAEQFNVSARTLRRRLQGEGLNFTAIVEETQTEIACKMLAQPRVSIKAVAYQLGFEEPGSFTRAFKRWTGKTPQDYRNQLIC